MELGWNYAQKGMYPEAVAECQRALDLIPISQVVLGSCGNIYRRAGRPQDASALLARLTTLARKNYVDPLYFVNVYDGGPSNGPSKP
jgi:predicted Zn-dependent protease